MTNLNIVDSEQQLRKRRSKSFKTINLDPLDEARIHRFKTGVQ